MMLQAKNVHKSFDGKEILKGISLDVEKGDVVAILGPSGSGKTTFLRCLNFLERADQGQLIFDGEEIDLHAAHKKKIAQTRQKTAFVFQNYNLFQNKTVLQNDEPDLENPEKYLIVKEKSGDTVVGYWTFEGYDVETLLATNQNDKASVTKTGATLSTAPAALVTTRSLVASCKRMVYVLDSPSVTVLSVTLARAKVKV